MKNDKSAIIVTAIAGLSLLCCTALIVGALAGQLIPALVLVGFVLFLALMVGSMNF